MLVKWGRAWRAMIPCAVLVTVVAGCGGTSTVASDGGPVGDPKHGGELVMAVNIESKTLDPAWCPYNYDRCAPIFGTLLEYDAESDEMVSAMAESFESTDGVTWILKLRDGVKFSDGTPYDAEAVAFNWARIKDPATLSTATELAAPLTWRVVDPLTLEVTSATPNFQLPWAMTQGLGMIGSPTAMQEMGADYGNAPIGAGPFLLESWTRDTEARYVANPDYWDANLPYLDSFVLKVIKHDDQRLNALRAGEIDIAWSTQSKDAKTMEAEGFTVHTLPLVGGTGLNLNLEDPVLEDPDLRLAIQKSIDPKGINAAVYPGTDSADAFLRPDSEFRDDALGKYPELNLDEAQKIFDSYLSRTGKSDVTLSFNVHAGIPDLTLVAQVLQSQLQKINGLTVNIEPVEYGALETMRRAGDFQMVLGSTLSQQMDALYDTFHSGGKNNITGFSNPEVDAALETTRTSNDPEDVKAAYQTVNGVVSEDAPIRTWRYPEGYIFSQKDVEGLKVIGVPSAAGVIVDEVWLNK
ncbi:Oligopeptide-binding protein AppA [Rhodococcus sp. B50]|nr:Oligopeptide-binding protein AppA [Rhodococcus sp. B50]